MAETKKTNNQTASPLLAWSPPGMERRLAYSRGLIRELDAAQECTGVLLGKHIDGQLQVLSARRHGQRCERGLEAIGIFATRVRGEIFLTESDLERLGALESKTAVALIAVGRRAGFFVREPDGSIQSIKSHQEFAIERHGLEKPPRRTLGVRTWAWPAFALAAIPVMAFPDWHPRAHLDLSVREDSGQLRIAWAPRAVQPGSALEIIDGPEHRFLPVYGSLNSATYQPLTGNVQIRLGRESVRFLGPDPPAP